MALPAAADRLTSLISFSLCSKQLSVSRLGLLGRRALSSAATPHYDVVIAGSGVMGCSVAYHLAESSSLKIAVAEKDCTVRLLCWNTLFC